MERPPVSKLAIGFYVLATIWLGTLAMPVLFLGRMAAAMGGGLGTVALTLLLQPVAIALFGGVVQMLSDIRWAALRGPGKIDA